MIDLALTVLLALSVLSLFVFVYIRENAINKKLKSYEKAFDALNQGLHKLEKELKDTKESMVIMSNMKPEAPVIKGVSFEDLTEMSRLIIEQFQELQKESSDFRDGMLERFVDLESKVRPIATMTSPNASADESKIMALYDDGFNCEEIAKQLRIGTGEVEFVLKLHNLK